MLLTSLAVAAAMASKWAIAGAIMTAAGTGLLTAGPIIDRWIDEKTRR